MSLKVYISLGMCLMFLFVYTILTLNILVGVPSAIAAIILSQWFKEAK